MYCCRHSHNFLAIQQGKSCPFPIWEMPRWFAEKNDVQCLQGNPIFGKAKSLFLQQGFPRSTSTCIWTCSVNMEFIASSPRFTLEVLTEDIPVSVCRGFPTELALRGYPCWTAKILLQWTELQPGTQCVRNYHISIAQHVSLFINRESLQILIWKSR